uniref:Uncharacterized protein n=1 Tax=Anopheles maculatus TaxID=74869 RepID=A0A182SD53_9DIPT
MLFLRASPEASHFSNIAYEETIDDTEEYLDEALVTDFTPLESPAPSPGPSRPTKRKAEASDERSLKRKVLNLVAERLETPPTQHSKYLATIKDDLDKTPEHMMPYF